MNTFIFRWRNPALFKSTRLAAGLGLALAIGLAPNGARACACGCGVYEVGTNSMLPTGTGILSSLDYGYQDQNRNWSGNSPAPAADNPDKDIRTDFFTLGFQDMLDRSWGLRLEVPYARRFFETTGGPTGDDIVAMNFGGLGDMRLEGIYTGFSPDLSSGLTFGLKLPTGSYTAEDAYNDVDRDSEIGTGSTDILLGGFDRFRIGIGADWKGFVQAQLDQPVLTQVQYRPGTELDAVVGAYYKGWRFGGLLLSPIGQIKALARSRDTGANASNPVASGFERVLVAPGIEADFHPMTVYADVELPVYQHFTGNQLAASSLFRLNVSYMF